MSVLIDHTPGHALMEMDNEIRVVFMLQTQHPLCIHGPGRNFNIQVKLFKKSIV